MSCFVFQLRTGFDRVVRGLWARALFAGPFAMLRRGIGIPLGWPRAVEFSSCPGPASPPRPAEALRSPLGLG